MDAATSLGFLELLTKYPAYTAVFIAWPIFFGVLMWWVLSETSKREKESRQQLVEIAKTSNDAVKEVAVAMTGLKGSLDNLAGRMDRLEGAVMKGER